MKLRVLILILLLCVLTPAECATNTWTGNTSQNWNLAANWSLNAVPSTADSVVINKTNGPILDSSVQNAVAYSLSLGNVAGTSGGLVLSGGSLNISDKVYSGSTGSATINLQTGSLVSNGPIYIGYNGGQCQWSMSGGLFKSNDIIVMSIGSQSISSASISGGTVHGQMLFVGDNGTASITLNGGRIETVGGMVLTAWPEAFGTVNMNAGEIVIGDFLIIGDRGRGVFNLAGGVVQCAGSLIMYSTSRLNICGGQLILTNGSAADVNPFIQSGQIVAYNGDPTYCVVVSSATPSGIILQSQRNDQPVSPDPFNGALLDVQDHSPLYLKWSGIRAAYDVYFGDVQLEVQNADVGTSGIYKGRVTQSLFNGVSLIADANYYWRIDSVDANGLVSKGDVWQFKTVTGFSEPRAYDLNGDFHVDFKDLCVLGQSWLSVVEGLSPAIPEENLLCWWRFEGNGVDSSGNGYGALMRDQVTTEGAWGSGRGFSSLSDSVSIPGFKGVLGTQSRSVAFWIKTSSRDCPVVCWGNYVASGGAWRIKLDDQGRVALDIRYGYINGLTPVDDGKWHHVAVIFDSNVSTDISGASIYIDGVPETLTQTANSVINTQASDDLLIGSNGSASFCGLLDEPCIYTRALRNDDLAWLCRRPYPEDLNGDGQINTFDLSGLASNWLQDYDYGYLLIDGFERSNFGLWQASGTAFGQGPATGSLPNQGSVSGYMGQYFINSFGGGDTSKGTLVSPMFVISMPNISFLIGGGNYPDSCRIELVINNKTVRYATGNNSETLVWRSWNVAEFNGQWAYLRIIDNESGALGHILIDHIMLTAKPFLPTRQVSLLVSQLGYNSYEKKQVVLRSSQRMPLKDLDNASFSVINTQSGNVAFTGNLSYWGAKWGSHFWRGDFSSLKTSGSFKIAIPELSEIQTAETSTFQITDNLNTYQTMVKVGMDQLDNRIETVPAEGDRPAIPTWRDSGWYASSELPSIGLTLHSLFDIYEKRYAILSSTDQQRLKNQISLGLNYILASQRRTASPLTDYWFEHCVQARLCLPPNPPYMLFFHDQAYVLTVLGRAYPICSQFDSQLAQKCIDAAEKCFDTCALRPTNLEADMVNRTLANDSDYYFPTTPQPAAREELSRVTRYSYNKPPTWKIPLQLRTREKMPFLWGSILLYKATSKQKFLDMALELADDIAERQFTDWQNPVEGAYGNFYEWPADNNSFLLEYCQNDGINIGQIEPTNLAGFIELCELFPDSNNIAKWKNVIYTYSEAYALQTAKLNPLGIYPLSVYRDSSQGGVCFFKNLYHGGTCLYGQIARNMVDLAGATGNLQLLELAENNLQFVLGVNPGFPEDYWQSSWKNQSLLKGIGANYFNPATGFGLKVAPVGSGYNGFTSHGQFFRYWNCEVPDNPDGVMDPAGKTFPEDNAYFNEDWLPHSAGFVCGVVSLEANFKLSIQAFYRGQPVITNITVVLNTPYNFQTGSDGKFETNALPLAQQGKIYIVYNGVTVSKAITTIGSGHLTWIVDFSNCVDVQLSSPEGITAGTSGNCELKIKNLGNDATTVKINLSADGVILSGTNYYELNVSAGSEYVQNFGIQAQTNNKPYMLNAFIISGLNQTSVISRGKVFDPNAIAPKWDESYLWVQQYKKNLISQQSGWAASGGYYTTITKPSGDLCYDFGLEAPTKLDAAYEVKLHIYDGGAAGIFAQGSELKSFRDSTLPESCCLAMFYVQQKVAKLIIMPDNIVIQSGTLNINVNTDYIVRLGYSSQGTSTIYKVWLDGNKVIEYRFEKRVLIDGNFGLISNNALVSFNTFKVWTLGQDDLLERLIYSK